MLVVGCVPTAGAGWQELVLGGGIRMRDERSRVFLL